MSPRHCLEYRGHASPSCPHLLSCPALTKGRHSSNGVQTCIIEGQPGKYCFYCEERVASSFCWWKQFFCVLGGFLPLDTKMRCHLPLEAANLHKLKNAILIFHNKIEKYTLNTNLKIMEVGKTQLQCSPALIVAQVACRCRTWAYMYTHITHAHTQICMHIEEGHFYLGNDLFLFFPLCLKLQMVKHIDVHWLFYYQGAGG